MELSERFARGDLAAFESLFQQFQPEVYRWLLRLVRDPAAAEDLTVEVFWRIYRARARFDPSRSFGAWARRIASNAAVDHLRRVRRGQARLPVTLPARPMPSDAERDFQLRVERAFLQLPAGLRVVVELALIEGWSHDETAEALGISRTAVKFRVLRARKLLKKLLAREGIEP